MTTVPVVCLECGRTYKTIELGYDAPADAASHGYCPECLLLVEERWFSRKPREVLA